MVEAYSSTCNHYDTIINNESFLTCIDCGLEIEQIFCHPDTHDNDSIISTPISWGTFGKQSSATLSALLTKARPTFPVFEFPAPPVKKNLE